MAERKDYTEKYLDPETELYDHRDIAYDINRGRIEPNEINWRLVTYNYDPVEINEVISLLPKHNIWEVVKEIAAQYTLDKQNKTTINAGIQEYLEDIPTDFFTNDIYSKWFTPSCDEPMRTFLQYSAATNQMVLHGNILKKINAHIPKPQGRPTQNLFQSATIEREKSKEMKEFFLAKHNNLEIPNCKKDAHEIATIKEMVDKWQKENLFPTGKVSGTALVRFLKETGFSFKISEASLASFFNNIF